MLFATTSAVSQWVNGGVAIKRSRVGVGMNRSARGWTVKRFERSNGLDTVLNKKHIFSWTITKTKWLNSRHSSSSGWPPVHRHWARSRPTGRTGRSGHEANPTTEQARCPLQHSDIYWLCPVLSYYEKRSPITKHTFTFTLFFDQRHVVIFD